MSNKNLLNESQIRQFMKLAKLEPLTPGFVEGLTEASVEEGMGMYRDDDEMDEVRNAEGGGPGSGPRRGHGRGRGEADRLEEEAHEEKELDATERELGDMDDDVHDKDEEIDDLEADLDDADAAEGRMISVDDFLGALENALEAAMGEEVEITDMGDEVEDDVEMDAEMDMDGDDLDVAVDMDMDSDLDEDMLQEKAYTAKKEKPGADMRKGADKRGAEGTLAKTKGHGRVDYVNEEEELEEDKDYTAKKEKPGADKRKGAEKRGAEGTLAKTKGHGRVDYANESTEATDELVEQITKRVAARILKSALAKK